MLDSIYGHLKDVKKKDRRRSILLISLLLHFLLLILMFHSFISHSTPRMNLITEQSKELPAELKSRRGSLDTPTFFDFSDQAPAQETPAQNEEQPQQAVQAHQTIAEPAPAEQAQPLAQDTTEAQEQQEQTSHEAEFENEHAEHMLASKEVEETKTQKSAPTTTLLHEEAPPEKKAPAVDLKKLALSNLLKPSPQKKDAKQAPQPLKHEYRPETQAMQSNMPQLHNMPISAGGGLEDLGFDLAVRHGDPNKQASYEDLKYIPYGRTIAQLLFKEIMHEGSAQLFRRGGVAELAFTLDSTGKVSALHNALQTRSVLHDFLAKLIRTISPFPPIPKHFQKQNINFGLAAQPGQATLYIHIPEH